MVESKENTKPTRLEIFEERISQLTDFTEFGILLAQEGVPAILDQLTESQKEHSHEMLALHVGFLTMKVLRNRRREGLSIDILDILKDSRKMKRWNQEFLPDPELRKSVFEGINMGLQTSGI